MSAAADISLDRGLIIDLFAGGGGASLGISRAMGRPVDIAINHSAVAIEAHKRNHPRTRHYHEDIWKVSPREVCAGRSVGLLWASPACTHFSRAKGGTNPRSAKIRSLAWVVNRWAREVKPRVIFLENVEEFADWGPLGNDGLPNADKRGLTFKHWLGKLRALGYVVEYRSLVAADYGTPTTRKRLFLIARCDGRPIVWPEPTHAKQASLFARQWRAAYECIDFGIPCPSIFTRKKSLALATQRRIAAGIVRYVIQSASPFLVTLRGTSDDAIARSAHSADEPLRTVSAQGMHHALIAPSIVGSGGPAFAGKPKPITDPLGTILHENHRAIIAASLVVNTSHHGPRSVDDPLATVTTGGHHILTAASLIQSGYGEREGQSPRALDVQQPLGTVVSGAVKHAVVAAALVTKHYGGPRQTAGANAADPLGTVTTVDHHALTLATLGEDRSDQVRAFLREHAPGVVPVVRVGGNEYVIGDIGMRMLDPRELFAAQGFPSDYDVTGMTKTQQVALCGNSVCMQVAEAIVRANVGRG
jgi:DNA (cytosine-5)-methyltransferase 1